MKKTPCIKDNSLTVCDIFLWYKKDKWLTVSDFCNSSSSSGRRQRVELGEPSHSGKDIAHNVFNSGIFCWDIFCSEIFCQEIFHTQSATLRTMSSTLEYFTRTNCAQKYYSINSIHWIQFWNVQFKIWFKTQCYLRVYHQALKIGENANMNDLNGFYSIQNFIKF